MSRKAAHIPKRWAVNVHTVMDRGVDRDDIGTSTEGNVVCVQVELHPVLKITFSPPTGVEVHNEIGPNSSQWSLNRMS